MALVYDEVYVNFSDIITVTDIALPTSGRKLKFINNNFISSNVSVDIYLLHEGKLDGPVENGDAFLTSSLPIIGKIISNPYGAKAIVVSKGYYDVTSSKKIEFDYSLKSSMNMAAAAHIVVEFNGTFHITNTRKIVEQYLEANFSLCDTVSSYINSFLKNSVGDIINALNKLEDATAITNYFPDISSLLSKSCVKDFNEEGYFESIDEETNKPIMLNYIISFNIINIF